MTTVWRCLKPRCNISDLNTKTYLEVHHKRLLSPDIYRLIAIEVISYTRIYIDTEPVHDYEFNSESGSCRQLNALDTISDTWNILDVLHSVNIGYSLLDSSACISVELDSRAFNYVVKGVDRYAYVLQGVLDFSIGTFAYSVFHFHVPSVERPAKHCPVHSGTDSPPLGKINLCT